jgi:hypothetical protein
MIFLKVFLIGTFFLSSYFIWRNYRAEMKLRKAIEEGKE